MTTQIPPAPVRDPWGSYTWEDWFRLIRQRAMEGITSVLWGDIDFTASNITSILTRRHNDLQSIQGGTSAEYYHLTSAQHSALTNALAVTSTATSGSMSDTYHTYRVTASGTTQTLPAASTARIGQVWTVVLETSGSVTVAPAGSDTIVLPTTDTTVTIYDEGTSISLKCLSATSWGIV